ncbi:probable chromosome-partitioning protein ParB [Trichonephila clavata]|uniref:Probable chromosome-partitioning protein ParB n=1 Tax=Trichonephila clavata TaxID=2740835 RepID=A0A8X6F9B6_TRICU|nr:probable chromosome-partitioning protein ParB [Trichonephila clavata]
MEKGGELTIRTFNQKIDSLNSTSQDMFSPDKETIEHGNYVVIEVIDTGCGMTSDTIGKPIVVRKDSNDDGYEIIAGERRWRASKIANLDSAPVIIKDLSDKECLEVSIIENIQRQDINPIEEGEAYRKLIDEFFYTHEELASAIGKSRSHITNMIRMLLLPDRVKTMINEKKLSMGHARALINVENAESIAERIVSQGLSVRQTEKLIKDLQQKYDQKEHKCTKNQDIAALEGAISSQLGLKIKINDSNSKGKVMIRYNNPNELNLILKI